MVGPVFQLEQKPHLIRPVVNHTARVQHYIWCKPFHFFGPAYRIAPIICTTSDGPCTKYTRARDNTYLKYMVIMLSTTAHDDAGRARRAPHRTRLAASS
jgi:hypothetical protein